MYFHLAILTQEGAVTKGGAVEQGGQGAGQAGDVVGISNTDIFTRYISHSNFYSKNIDELNNAENLQTD
jgi:hypothetical protein